MSDASPLSAAQKDRLAKEIHGKHLRRNPRPTQVASFLAHEFLARDDAFWGITEDEEGAKFANGSAAGYSAVVCTGFARAIRDKLGRSHVVVKGFHAWANPCRISREYGGHDFAIVDNRYIVDPWLTDVCGEECGVFDLINDAILVGRTYGTKWEDEP